MDTKALRQKMLDLAIRGKLVPQDPNDEPASVLLERIRQQKQQMVKEGKLKAKDIKNDSIIYVGEDNLHYEKFADGSVKCIEDEIPFEIPDGWAWARIWSIVSDLPYGTAQKSAPTGKVAVLRMGNIQSGEIDYSDLVYSSDASDIAKYSLQEDDLLFNRTNSAEWVGKTAIYRGDLPAIYAGYLIRLRTQLCADYLNAVMNSTYAKDYCNRVKTDGVNQSNINAQKLGAFLVPVSPIAEQHKISAFIKRVLPLIVFIQDEKENVAALIQKAKSKILDLAIRGQLVPQDPNDEPASVLLERIRAEKEEFIKQGKIKRDKKESVIFKGEDNSYYLTDRKTTVDISDDLPFDIPDSWCWTCLKDVFIINPRNKLEDDLEVSFIPMPLIDDGYSGKHTSEVRQWKEIKTGFTHFAEGDVGIAKITPCFENRKSTVFENLSNGYGAGTTELHILRPYGDTILAQYLLAYIKSDFFVENGKQTFTGAVGQQRIGKDYVEDAYFPVPPIDEQKRIVNQIGGVFGYLNMISSALSLQTAALI